MPTYVDTDFHLRLAIPLRMYVLHAGGVAHTAFAPSMIHMLDRNVISDVSDTANIDSDLQRFWLHLLDKPGAQLTAVFAASEGAQRRRPVFDEYVDALSDATGRLQAFFKHASVATFSPEGAKIVFDALDATKDQEEHELRFYLEAADLVSTTVKTGMEGPVESDLVSLARKHHVDVSSFVFVAFLASLYCKESNPAYEMLFKKKKRDMTAEQMAYNAVADCHHLRMLASCIKLMPEATLVTGDSAMAKFWKDFQVVRPDSSSYAIKARANVLRRLSKKKAIETLVRVGVPCVN